jgi:hypothetical protein
MSEQLYLILKKKDEKTRNGDILQKILKGQEFNLKDYDVSYASSFEQLILNYRDEIVDYILEHGVSHLLNIQILNEDVVAVGAPQSKILQVLLKYLKKLEIDNELIITDPFFLAPTRIPNYSDLIEALLVSFLPVIDVIRIITSANPAKIDTSLKSTIETKLKSHKPSLQIIHATTNDFHDRYWISGNREKGLVTGTSLNGLGIKFALVDRLNTSDVRQIVTELTGLGLL